MRTTSLVLIVVAMASLCACKQTRTTDAKTEWPTKEWAKSDPQRVGLDQRTLEALDADLKSGKYPLVDSFAVFRCGQEVFAREYEHDYANIYGKEAKTRGPLNARLTGPYNYFDPAWHPYYHGTKLHSMQSVSKTMSSIIIGIAMLRGDFKAGLDTPVLKYFDAGKVKNVDGRKRSNDAAARADDDFGAGVDGGCAIRRSAQRFEFDGGDRQLGAIRDRQADGGGTGKSFCLQQRCFRIVGAYIFERDREGH